MINQYPIKKVKNIRVLLIGDIILDRYWFGNINRISPEAPVPIFKLNNLEDRLGGAANVAKNLITLGSNVHLVGLIGKDDHGNKIKFLSLKFGIQNSLLQNRYISTIIKIRILSGRQQILRIDFEKENIKKSSIYFQKKFIYSFYKYDILILSDYSKGCLNNIKKIIYVANKIDLPVIIDPKGLNYKYYYKSTLIKPNKSEIYLNIGECFFEKEILYKSQILKIYLNIKYILITRSNQGMTLFTNEGFIHINSYTRKISDVSGAGDTVLAMLAITYSSNMNLYNSIYWMNKAGTISIRKFGTYSVSFYELI